MKRFLHGNFFILTVAWLLLGDSLCLATDNNNNKKKQQPRHLLGGYSAVPDIDADDPILEAAALAVRTLRVGAASSSSSSYSFISDLPTQVNDGDVHIVRAFSQVVAGLNYRLVLAVVPASSSSQQQQQQSQQQQQESSCVGAFAVTVYNHFGEMSVTKWGQEIDCRRAMEILQDKENNNDLTNPMASEFNG